MLFLLTLLAVYVSLYIKITKTYIVFVQFSLMLHLATHVWRKFLFSKLQDLHAKQSVKIFYGTKFAVLRVS